MIRSTQAPMLKLVNENFGSYISSFKRLFPACLANPTLDAVVNNPIEIV